MLKIMLKSMRIMRSVSGSKDPRERLKRAATNRSIEGLSAGPFKSDPAQKITSNEPLKIINIPPRGSSIRPRKDSKSQAARSHFSSASSTAKKRDQRRLASSFSSSVCKPF